MPKIVVIDTETTGLGHRAYPRRDDAIIQVGIAWRDASGRLLTWGETCLPDRKYLANDRAGDALAVNGIPLNKIYKARSDVSVAQDLRKRLAGIAAAHGRGRALS